MASTPRPSIRDQVNLDEAAAVAVDDETQAGPGILGKIVFYAVADTIRVAADELERLFTHYRIAESYLPKPIDPAQSLRSVVGSKEIAISLGGADHVVAFREETKLDGSLFIRMYRSRPRSIAERRKLVPPGGDPNTVPEWEVETVGAIGWDPETSDAIDYEVFEGHEREWPYDQILAGIEQEWDEKRQFYGRAQVSTAISQILNDTMSIRTRPTGGVWLVPTSAMEMLDRVEELIHVLDTEYRREGDGDDGRHSEFDSIILVDRNRNKLFVKTKVEAEISERLDRAIVGLLALVESGKTPSLAQLNDATTLRREAIAYRDQFAAAFGDYAAIDAKLADFDRAYAAAVKKMGGA
jgi:hypothetical protein